MKAPRMVRQSLTPLVCKFSLCENLQSKNCTDAIFATLFSVLYSKNTTNDKCVLCQRQEPVQPVAAREVCAVENKSCNSNDNPQNQCCIFDKVIKLSKVDSDSLNTEAEATNNKQNTQNNVDYLSCAAKEACECLYFFRRDRASNTEQAECSNHKVDCECQLDNEDSPCSLLFCHVNSPLNSANGLYGIRFVLSCIHRMLILYHSF